MSNVGFGDIPHFHFIEILQFFIRTSFRCFVVKKAWMKLVDLYVLPKLFGTGLDKDEMLANFAKEQLDSIGISKETILKKREEIYKHRAMKRYMVRIFRLFSIEIETQPSSQFCGLFLMLFISLLYLSSSSFLLESSGSIL